MYKCLNCRAMFESTREYREEPCYVPAPFGCGSVEYGGGSYEGCPECGSTDYEIPEFDGCCPNCGEIIIEDDDWDYYTEFECECEKCKKTYYISNGDIVE